MIYIIVIIILNNYEGLLIVGFRLIITGKPSGSDLIIVSIISATRSSLLATALDQISYASAGEILYVLIRILIILCCKHFTSSTYGNLT